MQDSVKVVTRLTGKGVREMGRGVGWEWAGNGRRKGGERAE